MTTDPAHSHGGTTLERVASGKDRSKNRRTLAQVEDALFRYYLPMVRSTAPRSVPDLDPADLPASRRGRPRPRHPRIQRPTRGSSPGELSTRRTNKHLPCRPCPVVHGPADPENRVSTANGVTGGAVSPRNTPSAEPGVGCRMAMVAGGGWSRCSGCHATVVVTVDRAVHARLIGRQPRMSGCLGARFCVRRHVTWARIRGAVIDCRTAGMLCTARVPLSGCGAPHIPGAGCGCHSGNAQPSSPLMVG